MHRNLILLTTITALGVAATCASANDYIARANGLTDSGPTAPRQILNAPAGGSLNSGGESSAFTVPGDILARSYFENPISCLCTPQGSSTSEGIINANDLVVTGPPGVVQGVLHMQLEGIMAHSGDHPWSSAIEMAIYPQGSSYFGRINLYPDGHWETSGSLTGVTGPTINVSLELPCDFVVGNMQLFTIDFQTSAGGQSLGTTVNSAITNFWDDVDLDGIGGIHFVSGSPAISLPPGYFLNSAQLGIADNYWNGQPAAVTPPLPIDDLKLVMAPNPAASRSTLSFDLPRDGCVRVEILDLAGREIRLLENGEVTAGSHNLPWDGRDGSGRTLASGLYFARVEFEGRVHVARVAILGR